MNLNVWRDVPTPRKSSPIIRHGFKKILLQDAKNLDAWTQPVVKRDGEDADNKEV